MTATIIQLRDYKRPEERQAAIDQFALAVVDQALWPTDQELFEIEAMSQADSGDCA